MAGKGTQNRSYDVHGDDAESLTGGFEAIAMPNHRRSAARRIVDEVLASNNVVNFSWYKTDGTDELACYWDDHPVNMMWITRAEVHVRAERGLALPDRSTDWTGLDGELIGWSLPGALPGTGGGPRTPEPERVVCPVTFISQPAGTLCPECEILHSPPAD